MREAVLFALRFRLRRALLRWCVRTVIGVLLFSWLAWRFPWGRWVLYTWIPLSLLSLGVIVWGFREASRRSKRLDPNAEEVQMDVDRP